MKPAIEANGVSVRYGQKTAVDNVSANVHSGQLCVLLGENGAGKTSLLKCMAGLLPAASGRCIYQGGLDSRGVGMLRQDAGLVADMTVLENFALVRPRQYVSYSRLREQARAMLDASGAAVDLDCPAGDLSFGERQQASLIWLALGGWKAWLLDEPTAALTPAQAAAFMSKVRAHADNGGLAVVSSHRIDEALAHADYVYVMRAGKITLATPADGLADADVHKAIFGPETVAIEKAKGSASGDETAIALEQLVLPRWNKSIDLQVRSGQTVGIAGIAGNGQAELIGIMAGLAKSSAGRIRVCYHELASRNGRKLGLHCILEDPVRDMCMLDMSVAENLILHDYADAPFSRFPGLLSGDHIELAARRFIDKHRLGIEHPASLFGWLSGGNRRKLAVQRELAGQPRAIVAHNPTAGLDRQATAEIIAALRRACEQGAGVLICSEDLEMLLDCCDRLFVMKQGKLIAVDDSQDAQSAARKIMAM